MLHSTPWCSSLALGSSGGDRWDVGPGAPAVDRNPGQQRPHPEQKALSSSILVLVTGPRNYQEAGKHPFLCQRCVISLMEIVPSEKAMATHFHPLAWKNPRTERPGRLQSMGLLRVEHYWVNSLSLFTFLNWRKKWQPTPVFLPGESQGRWSLVGSCLWGCTELDMTEVT